MAKHPDQTDIIVGSRVRMRRLMLDLSQSALAEALGITFQQIQKYEKGANRISASRLQQVANFRQVPVAFFFEGLSGPAKKGARAEEPSVPDHVTEFITSADGLSLIKSFTQIRSKNLRHLIVALVEDLAG